MQKRIKKRNSSRVVIGDSVTILRDIFRLPDPVNKEEALKFRHQMLLYSLELREKMPTCAPFCAEMQLYAKESEEGVVIEIFRSSPTHPLTAKVRMSDGKIKTFRLTSFVVT